MSPDVSTPQVTRLDRRRLFEPRSVAIVGASGREDGHAARALRNLLESGFPGRLYPVNPKYAELLGLRCYPEVTDLPEVPDVAYVLVPADRSVEAVRACAGAGIKLAIVCSSGFAELGDHGRALQDELRRIARESGTRVLGPNCIGIVAPGRFHGAPTYNVSSAPLAGGLAILSHSGGIGATLHSRAHAVGAGVHSMVSLGNAVDLDVVEVLDALLDDDELRVAALVLEQLRDPEGFRAVAARAIARGVRLVALKNGRSDAGARAVVGHTGALAGERAAFSAWMRACGVLEAQSLDELLDTAQLLLRTDGAFPNGGLGIISPSGGEAIYAADQATDLGLVMPEFSETLHARLQELMPLGRPGNPLDLTGAIIGQPGLLADVLGAVAEEPRIGALLICLPTWGAHDAVAILPRVLKASTHVPVPVVFSAWQAGAMTAEVHRLLVESGLPWFPSPDRALRALRLGGTPQRPRTDVAAPSASLPRPTAGGALSGLDGLTLLAAAGLPVVEERVATTTDEVVEVAREWGGELVIKLHAPGVLHKSDLGLVEVGVASPLVARQAAARLRARAADAGLAGPFSVARRERGFELIVGAIRDPHFGPMVLVGAGGVHTEHHADSVLLPAPATPEEALDGIRRLRCWPLLDGFRGSRGDVEAAVRFVVRVSEVIAAHSWIAEIDLNPVLVRDLRFGGGCVAVDAVVAVARSGDGADS